MKKLALIALAAVACGGSDKNTTTSGTVKGTIGGASFVSADGVAFAISPTTCTIGDVTEAIAAVGVSFSTLSGMCQLAKEHLCDDKKDLTGASVFITRSAPTAALAAISPGTYTITASPRPDANGVFTFASAGASKTDGACHDAMSGVTATAGTIVIEAISPNVKGSANVTFSDGSTFSGSFDAAKCGVFDLDVCSPGSSAGTCSQHTPACI